MRSDVAAALDGDDDQEPRAELTRQGYRASADTVGDLLREEGFSPQAAKALEGRQHPDITGRQYSCALWPTR